MEADPGIENQDYKSRKEISFGTRCSLSVMWAGDKMKEAKFEICKKCKVEYAEYEAIDPVIFKADKINPHKIVVVREILIMACPKCGKFDPNSIRIGWL